jgi:STE24 endopeptidase
VSRATAARAAVAAVLAAGWALAAWLLWRSSVVPASLRLPHLDAHAYFTKAQLNETASFGRFTLVDWILMTLAELVALAIYARKGIRFARESAAGRLGTGMLLGMIGFALVWAAQLPFDVAALWWERRHHLTHVGYFEHVFGNWLGLGGQFVFLCLALAVVMRLARALPKLWWAAAAPFFIALVLLFAFVSPWLIPTHRLSDPALRPATVRLERVEHVRRIPVVVENVHDVTSLPNAEATGLGPSRRVVL